jgi:hypothetical protein
MPKLNVTQIHELLQHIYARCTHFQLHNALKNWELLSEKIQANAAILQSIYLMEQSGGEPALLQLEQSSDAWHIVDCAIETPQGRRSLCYDDIALDSRKENKPQGSAIGMASKMGITLLNEMQYRMLQTFITVDLKTSSWLLTPDDIRKAGGALFGDFRYGHTFVYHNGAQSYYAARGFRGFVTLPPYSKP